MSGILITGASGLAGRILAEVLSAQGPVIVGGDLNVDALPTDDPLRGQVRMLELDVRQAERLADVLAETRPDTIYHMAAVVPIRIGLETPAAPLEANVIGTANLLEAVRKVGLNPRIVMAGSSEEYGRIYRDEVPVSEDQPLRPSNPYGVSKVAQTLLGIQYAHTYGMDLVVGRGFNLTGPGQSPDYACPAFARQIAEIESGLAEPVVRVGDLSARRDYNDVRDIARGYALLAEKGVAGEIYNVCTGTAHSMREIVDRLIALSGMAIRVEVDPARVRPAENPLIIGDNSKIVAATGYRPDYSLDQTLTDVLNTWRGRAREARRTGASDE